MITTVEAAVILGVRPDSVARAAQQSRLPVAAKAPGLRGAYFFDRSTIAALAVARGVKL